MIVEGQLALVSIRLPVEERDVLRRIAEANDRKWSQEVRLAIRFYLMHYEQASQELAKRAVQALAPDGALGYAADATSRHTAA